MVLRILHRYTVAMRHLQIYTAIDTIARLGSIRQAAEALAISPSALNRQILGVEADLGVQLFDRLPNGVRLSTSGEIYIKSFRDHVADLKRVESQLADLSGQRIGTVRIGAGPEFASGFLPRQVQAYQRAFPKVNFSIETFGFDALADQIVNGGVDIGLAIDPVLSPGIQTVSAQDIAIVGISSDPKVGVSGPLTFSDLAQRPLIVPTGRSGLRNAIDAAFAGRRIEPRYLVETDAMVQSGLLDYPDALWVIAANNMDRTVLEQSGLTLVPIANSAVPGVQAGLMQLEHRILSISASSMLNILATELEQGDS